MGLDVCLSANLEKMHSKVFILSCIAIKIGENIEYVFASSHTRKCRSDDFDDQQQQPGVAKHKLISKAFAKRHQLPTKGRLSVSLYSTHEDPVGLNKLLDPIQLCVNNGDDRDQSQMHTNTDGHDEISSEWAAGLPRLVARRGGLIPPSSNSVSYMSEDSRRPSCDSAMSDMAVRVLQSSTNDRAGAKKYEFFQHFGSINFFSIYLRFD